MSLHTARGRKTFKSVLLASAVALSFSVAGPVFAQDANATAETATKTSSYSQKLDVGAIDLTNANIDEGTLRDILTGNLKENADQLANLNAARIRIPELRFSYEMSVDGLTSTNKMVMKEIVLENVKDGTAERAWIEEIRGDFANQGAEETPMDSAVFTYGKSEINALNLRALLAAYGLVSGSSDQLVPVYDDYLLAGGKLEAETFGCDFGAVQSGKFSAKAGSMDFAKMTSLVESMEVSGQEPSQEQIAAMVDFYAQMLYGFESDPITMDGIACAGEDKGSSFTLSTGELSMGGFGNGIYPEIQTNDIKVVVEGKNAGTFSVDNFTFKPIDFKPTFDALDTATQYSKAWFEANGRAMIPAIEGFSLSGVKFDVPNTEQEGERAKGALDKLDVTLGQYQKGIPSDIRIEAIALQADLPQQSEAEGLQKLIDAGLTSINLGFVADLNWDKAAETININSLHANLKDFGSIDLTGKITGATEALFDADPNMAMMSAMSLAVTEVNLIADDEGLVAMALKSTAEEQGAPVEAFTMQVTMMSQGMIVGMLGGTQPAVELGKNVSGFLGGGKKLEINLTAKSSTGLGMPQLLMLQSDPTKLLNFVDVVSTLE